MSIHPLRAFRIAKRLTLEQVGRVFAVDKSTVMRWEGGNIPAERVLPVSKFAGIRPGVICAPTSIRNRSVWLEGPARPPHLWDWPRRTGH